VKEKTTRPARECSTGWAIGIATFSLPAGEAASAAGKRWARFYQESSRWARFLLRWCSAKLVMSPLIFSGDDMGGDLITMSDMARKRLEVLKAIEDNAPRGAGDCF
jgi:hypothetical protein